MCLVFVFFFFFFFVFFLMIRRPPRSTLFPYTRRSSDLCTTACGTCRSPAARLRQRNSASARSAASRPKRGKRISCTRREFCTARRPNAGFSSAARRYFPTQEHIGFS